MVKEIVLYLTPLQALKLNDLLKPTADKIEAVAVRENRVINANEDLTIDTLSKLNTQIYEQIQYVEPIQIEQEQADYTRQFLFEQNDQAENN